MKIAVMGAGAVGCYFGAILARAGHTVRLIGRPQHVEAINRFGLRLESKIFDGYVPMQATTEADGIEDADIVLFCVKSMDTEAAGRAVSPFMKTDAAILCLQNGVDNAERLQSILKRTVIPAAVYVAAEMAGPGYVKHHGRGELIIGHTSQSSHIAEILNIAGIPVTVSKNVLDTLWVKLIANCSFNALSAISQLPYGTLIGVNGVREVIQSIVEECVSVAEESGISIPKNIHDITLAIATAMPDQYSSTAQDLARGKPTEIDYLNGYIVSKGAQLGVPTPINLLLQTMVKLKEVPKPLTVPS